MHKIPGHPDYPYAQHPEYDTPVTFQESDGSGGYCPPMDEDLTLGRFLDINVEAAQDDFPLAEVDRIRGAIENVGEVIIPGHAGMSFRVAKRIEVTLRP